MGTNRLEAGWTVEGWTVAGWAVAVWTVTGQAAAD